MGKTTTTAIEDMATALEKAVAMYMLLHDHAAGRTDLTEDQLGAVVTGICDEARVALARARDEGLVPSVYRPPARAPAHGDPIRAPHVTVM